MLGDFVPIVECEIAHMYGFPDLWKGQVVIEVILIGWCLCNYQAVSLRQTLASNIILLITSQQMTFIHVKFSILAYGGITLRITSGVPSGFCGQLTSGHVFTRTILCGHLLCCALFPLYKEEYRVLELMLKISLLLRLCNL